jgi:hypothetical protein
MDGFRILLGLHWYAICYHNGTIWHRLGLVMQLEDYQFARHKHGYWYTTSKDSYTMLFDQQFTSPDITSYDLENM